MLFFDRYPPWGAAELRALLMKVKVISKRVNFWNPTASSDSRYEVELNEWLAAHPSIKIIEVKHDLAFSLFSGSVLVVSIYYAEQPH